MREKYTIVTKKVQYIMQIKKWRVKPISRRCRPIVVGSALALSLGTVLPLLAGAGAGPVPPPGLPRFHFQDRWVISDEAAQRHALSDFDLREAGHFDRTAWNEQSFFLNFSPAVPRADWREHFAVLQKADRVLEADLSRPGRIVLNLEVSHPAMLVLTDDWSPDWRATVDGRGEPLHRVNSSQIGLWCPAGTEKVVMESFPGAVRLGLVLAAIGLFGAFVVPVTVFRKSGKKGKRR